MRAHPERALRAHRLLPGSECLPAVRRAPTLTRAGYQIAASTPLQMMLYFSVPYGLLFAVANQMLFYWKARTFDVPLVVAVVDDRADFKRRVAAAHDRDDEAQESGSYSVQAFRCCGPFAHYFDIPAFGCPPQWGCRRIALLEEGLQLGWF